VRALDHVQRGTDDDRDATDDGDGADITTKTGRCERNIREVTSIAKFTLTLVKPFPPTYTSGILGIIIFAPTTVYSIMIVCLFTGNVQA